MSTIRGAPYAGWSGCGPGVFHVEHADILADLKWCNSMGLQGIPGDIQADMVEHYLNHVAGSLTIRGTPRLYP